MITGSHNPADYNGFKMVLGGTAPSSARDIQELGRMAAAGDWEEGAGAVARRGRDGPLCRAAARRASTAAPSGSAGTRQRRRRAGARAAGRSGCRASIITLYTEVDGRFPNHHPDPTEEANLADLKALVAREGPRFRHRLRRRRRPDRRGRRRGPGGLGRPAARDPRRAGARRPCPARRSSPTSRRARRCSTGSPSWAASR